jgi:hypothetical protein
MSDYSNVSQQISDPISENLANGDIGDCRSSIEDRGHLARIFFFPNNL